MVKGMGKRAYHKRDMNKVNKAALTIGAIVAIIILLAIILSFLS